MSDRHVKGYMPWDRTGNPLLVKSQLGKNKPTNYEIPTKEFVYGQLTYEDPQHSNELMYRWKYSDISPNGNNFKQKDFSETNKAALKNLLHTSSQFSHYRKTNTVFKGAYQGSNVISIKLPQQNHAYGKPLNLQDPVKLLIANNYGEVDKYARHTFYQQQTSKNDVPLRKLSCFVTKNHNLLKEATARRLLKFDWNHNKQLWKLNKFSEVGNKVETRRPHTKSSK